ncbi:hypothetical protein HK104_000847 [Borealophlyctis nickersoniae]|nr:hypothetical protein HK104_000847 [Borealophlyctis nickersoniae]
MCATIAPTSDHPIIVQYARERGLTMDRVAEVYQNRARGMVAELLDRPSLDVAVGLGCLGTSCTAMGEAALAHSFASMSVRMATDLRLNIDPDVEEVHGPLTWLEKEARRRAWWTACVLDAVDSDPDDSSAPTIPDQDLPRLDRVPFVDRSRSVKAPAPEALWQSVTTLDGLPTMSAFVPGEDLDLADLTGRLFRILSQIRRLGAKRKAAAAAAMSGSASSLNKGGSPPPYVESPEEAAATANRIAELESALHETMAALPAWARNIDQCTTFSGSTVSKNPPPYQLLVQHIVYHALIIALHLPALIQSVPRGSGSGDDSPPTTPPPPTFTPATQQTYQKCHTHALRTAHLLTLILNSDPRARHISAWCIQFVFYSAVILMMSLKTSRDESEVEEARKGVDVCVRFVRVFGAHEVSRRVVRVLEEMMVEGEGVGAVLEGWREG